MNANTTVADTGPLTPTASGDLFFCLTYDDNALAASTAGTGFIFTGIPSISGSPVYMISTNALAQDCMLTFAAAPINVIAIMAAFAHP